MHKIQSRDTFSGLAVRYFGHAKYTGLIEQANPEMDANRLQIGGGGEDSARAGIGNGFIDGFIGNADSGAGCIVAADPVGTLLHGPSPAKTGGSWPDGSWGTAVAGRSFTS